MYTQGRKNVLQDRKNFCISCAIRVYVYTRYLVTVYVKGLLNSSN